MATMSVSEVANLSDSQKAAKVTPITTFVWVNNGDIDAVNYVSGCEGKVKRITEYVDLAKTMIASDTIFKYQDLLNPTKATEITSLLG